jgi:hypothetical protein
MLAEQANAAGQQPIVSPLQGWAMLANEAVTGLQARQAKNELGAGRDALAALQSKIGLNEPSPDQIAEVGRYDPELAQHYYDTAMQMRALQAKQEHWSDMPAPPGSKEGQLFQKNDRTGEVRAVGGSGITIQNAPPVPSEVAARLGLATGFLTDYDRVQKEVDAGNLTGTGYATSILLGRGTGGDAYRTIQAGSDALLRNLTGAGMPETEAAKYVKRYEPTLLDDAPTLHNKVAGLKRDLDNVQAAVTAGRKWLPDTTAEPPAGAPAAAGAPDAAAAPKTASVTMPDGTAMDLPVTEAGDIDYSAIEKDPALLSEVNKRSQRK